MFSDILTPKRWWRKLYGVHMKDFPEPKVVSTDSLIPYAMNSRTHSDKQVDQIAASIKEFGFLNPVIVDGENGIIAGHGRVMAAKKLGMTELPVVEARHLTEAQKKAYVIADNRLALNAGWDNEILNAELTELQELHFDIDLLGFDIDELKDILGTESEKSDEENPYTKTIKRPVYEPTGEKPDITDLYDDTRTFDLVEKIKNSNLPQKEKDFLMLAAGRHTILNFELIANYYAHSEKECQELMEDNALVIIDFNKAIEFGYASLSEKISEQYLEDYPDNE